MGDNSHRDRHMPTIDLNRRRMSQSLALLAGFMVFEVATALVAHSLALLADAGQPGPRRDRTHTD
jgi:Co/Zn/Cd efflux system component